MSDPTFLGQFIASLNANVFLREFSFSQTCFRPTDGTELELADHVVRIGPLVFLYQFKERNASGKTTVEAWIMSKVVKRATQQIRGTVTLLCVGHPVLVPNERGHVFDLAATPEDTQFRLILFKSGDSRTPLPYPRFHDSRSVGFIHIFDALDYFGICTYLMTPVEIADYLTWRAQTLQSCSSGPLISVSEAALVGQYMVGELPSSPDERYAGALAALHDDISSFDLSYLFSNLGDHVVYASRGERETSYYPILQLLARMVRSELRLLKERFAVALKAVKENRFEMPMCFVSPSLDCGVAVIPVPQDQFDNRLGGLRNLSLAAKYDRRTTNHIGISVARRGSDLMIDWCYASFPWTHDPEIEALLANNYPFRPMSAKSLPRYLFSTEQLRQSGLNADDPEPH